MLHYIIELEEHPEVVIEISNSEEAIVFKRQGEEFFRLLFSEFDQILEAVARSENING
jgi:hypothetical protein